MRLIYGLLPAILLAGCAVDANPEPHVESVRQELFGSGNGIPDGMKVGGGEEYGNWLPATNAITGGSDLAAIMAAASPGDVIYLDDDAVFDFDLGQDWDSTEKLVLELKAGVTLASGRGRDGSLGALLRVSTEEGRSFIKVTGPGARITGLRIEGPSTSIAPPNDCRGDDATGVKIESASAGLEFDNNEIWGWPDSAIRGGKTQALHVHDNHIHHNRRKLEGSKDPIMCPNYGLGYGAQVGDGANATIEKNIFNHNRHDIASNGAEGTEYTARYNLVLGGGLGHSFDVHEDTVVTGQAGRFFSIHNNTFQQDDHTSVRIRGVPEVGADVHDNEFMNYGCRDVLPTTRASVQQQINGVDRCEGFDNMDVGSNDENVDYLPAWYASFSGESFWSFRQLDVPGLSSVAFGDFDDEPGEDAFRAGGSGFEISSSAREPWTSLTSSSIAFSDLRFGNFGSAPGEIGASKTDIIREYQGQWKVWINGDGANWQTLNSNYMGGSLNDMRFADFDGDGVTDVFKLNSGYWRVSWGGQTYWQQLGWGYRSGYLSKLGFGNFDAQPGEDVIKLESGMLYISSGGSTGWSPVQYIGVNMSDVSLADVNGDGMTDIIKQDQGQWWVLYSGIGGWMPINGSTIGMSDLAFADLNGDGKDDFISRQQQ